MKTWIMSVDLFRVSVFQINPERKEVQFSTLIKSPYPALSSIVSRQISIDFAQYIAEEIEIACGCGTDNQVILSGSTIDTQKIFHCLSESVKCTVIGITNKGYQPDLWQDIRQNFLTSSRDHGHLV